jgi:hypothetical protein
VNDIEWLAYLGTLSPELAALAHNTAERVNTLLNRERSKAIGERQELERKIDEQRTKIADLRTIVRDLFDQLAERKVNDNASNAAGRPREP